MRFLWHTWFAVAACCIATTTIAQNQAVENLTTSARLLVAARNADADGLKRALADDTVVVIDCPVDYAENMFLTNRLKALKSPL